MTEKGSAEVWREQTVQSLTWWGQILLGPDTSEVLTVWRKDPWMENQETGVHAWAQFDKSHYRSWLVFSVVSGTCSLPLAPSSMLGLSRRSGWYQSGSWRCSTDPGERINFCVSFVTWYNISWGFFLILSTPVPMLATKLGTYTRKLKQVLSRFLPVSTIFPVSLWEKLVDVVELSIQRQRQVNFWVWRLHSEALSQKTKHRCDWSLELLGSSGGCYLCPLACWLSF